MIICIDFDGTCVTHEFPEIGEDIGAEPVLKKLVENGHKLVLFTMRSDGQDKGDVLSDAIRWFDERGIPLYGIQTNPDQRSWTTSPKAYGHIYIDDAALGVPLVRHEDGRPYVNWKKVERLLELRGLI
jgi:hypothetical protein